MHPTDSFDRGDGPETVLLLHGFSGTPWELRPLAEELVRSGRRCVAPLLPGHGRGVEELSKFRAQDWIDAGHELIDRLVDGDRRIFLVGFSAGGCLAIRLAAERSRDVAALALLAPALRLSGNARLYRSLFRHSFASRLVRKVPKGRRDVSDETAAAEAPYLPELPTAAAKGLDRLIKDGNRFLPQVRAPSLILYGSRDAVVPLSAARQAAEKIGSGPARLALFPKSAHQLALDTEREAVAWEVARFFGHFSTRRG